MICLKLLVVVGGIITPLFEVEVGVWPAVCASRSEPPTALTAEPDGRDLGLIRMQTTS